MADSVQETQGLVVGDGFYEWKKIDAKTKQPYAFGLKDDTPLAFADF